MALTIDGSDPTGDLGDLLASKLDLAGGKILQIVRATDSTLRTTTSTSFVDASISVTITPQKSDSAIFLMASFYVNAQSATANNIDGYLQITDASNNAISGAQNNGIGLFNYSGSATRSFDSSVFLWAYSTPAITSAVTYKVRFKSTSANTFRLLNADNTAQMYAIEVSA